MLVPRHGRVLLIRDPNGDQVFAAVSPGEVYSFPASPASFRDSGEWFGQAAEPVYVFDAKPFLALGVPADSKRVRDLLLFWWLLEPGRAHYPPAGLIRRELGHDVPAALPDIASALWQLAPLLEERLEKEELMSVYEEVEAPLTPILAAMEASGIGFDASPLRVLSKKMAHEISVLEKQIFQVVLLKVL